jgi:hypothetical protein
MGLKSKASVSLCLLILLSIFVYSAQIPAAHSWGANGHRFIESNAESVFSPNSFFSINHSTLYSWCTMPDSDPSFMPDGGGQSDWHFLDGHSYNPLVYTGGELPWAMQWIFDNIVQYFGYGDWNTATQLLGAICHFTGDSTQPLHSTWNYNPNGKHSAYETTALNAHLSEMTVPDNYLPQQLDNITAAALASLAKSFSYTAEGANPGDNNLTAFLMAGITWNDWIASMTENRLRSAVQFTANVWYSAMIQSGLTIQAPTLNSPSHGSSTNDNTPTFTWTSVSGTSYYDLQLASDNNFTINARNVKNLTTTSYTPTNPLPVGVWYWRVRAGDNSTDVGLYSQTSSFTVTASAMNPPVVVISPSSNNGSNGAVLTYTVTVTNTENSQDSFNLTASDNASPSWGPTVAPTSLTIPAGENRTATLSVTIPSNAVGGTIDNISVTASGAGGSGSKSCAATVTISRSVSVSISPGSKSGPGGATLNYTLTIHNMGNVSDNYSLTVTDNASPSWSPSVSPTWRVVPAFGSDNVTLSVTIPPGTMVGTVDNIKVTVNGTGDNSSVSCLAVVVMLSCAGTANVRLAITGTPPFLWGIREAKLNANLVIYQGDNLHLIFLAQDNVTVESDNVIWSRTAPGAQAVVLTSLVVPHDSGLTGNVKRAKLMLTDNSGAIILDNMAWYTVVQDDLSSRISWIILNWGSHNSSQQDQLSSEISQIIINWATFPSTRDQGDFSQ